MNFLNKLERKIGKYAVPNLTLYIIGTYVVGYLLYFMAPSVLQFLMLNPAEILHGQVWRIVSWLLIPPSSFGIFTILMLFVYYSLGNTLERSWGTFRYNVYIFGGILTTIIGSFVLYLVSLVIGGSVYAELMSYLYAGSFSTYYISMSIFLGFALTYPDMQMMLYFLIPIKIKWLAILDVVFLAIAMIQGDWGTRVVILSSLANVLVFFFTTRNYRRVSPKEIRRKQVYRAQTRQAQGVTKHKCAICGRTEKDGDNLEFRFCSRCEGNYEYCQDHLFTHEHRRRN